MKKIFIILSLLIVVGCARTPQPIIGAGNVSMQMTNAIREDFKMTTNDTFDEIDYWVNFSFGLMMQIEEEKIKNPDGTVNLEQYKELADRVATQMANVKGEYKSNRSDVERAIDAKIDKALILQGLIDKYNRSTGVDPETLNVLVNELGQAASDAYKIYKDHEAAKPEKEPSIQDRLNIVLKGKVEQMIDKIEAGEPLLPKDVRDRIIGGLNNNTIINPQPETPNESDSN